MSGLSRGDDGARSRTTALERRRTCPKSESGTGKRTVVTENDAVVGRAAPRPGHRALCGPGATRLSSSKNTSVSLSLSSLRVSTTEWIFTQNKRVWEHTHTSVSQVADLTSHLPYLFPVLLARGSVSTHGIDLGFSLVFESGCRLVSVEDDRECSGEPQDLCESLEPSIVRIGLATTELQRTMCKSILWLGAGARFSGVGLRARPGRVFPAPNSVAFSRDFKVALERGGGPLETTETRAVVPESTVRITARAASRCWVLKTASGGE